MVLKNYDIQLDNPWNTYYSGQTINGQVTFKFENPKKLRGILIRFGGESDTLWQESDDEAKEEAETESCCGHEEYFQTQYYLLGSKTGDEIELAPGKHSFPFTCELPSTLASSFESDYGYVRYTIKVILDRPWKFDQEVKMAFTVISPVDLNSVSSLNEPHTLKLQRKFWCFCCRSGPLVVNVHVPVTGFVSGQIIPITCECNNASNVHINSVNIVLRKLVTLRVTHPKNSTKYETVDIAEVEVGPTPRGESITYTQQITIPPLPPSNLVNCTLIDVDYQLDVEVDLFGPYINLKGNIPIVVGTIPLTSFKQPVPNQNLRKPLKGTKDTPSSRAGTGGAMGWDTVDNASGEKPYNILPPSFHETDFKPTTIMNKRDSVYTQIIGEKYTPRYPTYQY